MANYSHSQTGWSFRARWIMGGLMAFSAAMFYLTWWRPANRIQEALAADIAKVRAQLTEAQSQVATMPAIQADVDRLQAAMEPLSRRIPRQPELPAFIRDIGAICQQSAVKKFDWKQGEISRQDSLSELPVTMNVEGDFFAVYGFLKQAEEMQQLTRVHSLTLKMKDGAPGQMQAQMEMGLYFAE